MATTANSSSGIRTYTRDDATKYQIAYRSNNTWKEDANGRALPGSFTTNLQVDRTAIDRGVTCLLYTSPSPRDKRQSRMPSSA